MPLTPLHLLASTDPLEHVLNQPAVRSESGYWLWSSTQGNLVLSGIILIVVGLWAASKIKTGPASEGAGAYVTRNSFARFLEVLCVYLRDEVVRPLLGKRTNRFMPFLWTIFFFILVNNLLGLLPITDLLHLVGIHMPIAGGTATQNIWVTGAMALVAGLVFNIAALVQLGVRGFVKHMMGDLPWYMLPIGLLLLTIEAAGQFIIKPGALAIRLFANMTGGHVLLATLLIFSGSAIANALDHHAWGSGIFVSVISTLGAVAIDFLELFVAVLQAFVFMFLIAVFVSLMEHHEEHGPEHEHGHAHGHEHA
jgi:F-type H+-transporting ATPase subunit a